MKTVLIIDDDTEILDLTKRKLQKSGYRVLLAESGQEGLKLAAEQGPGLILLDIVMPLMDGFAVLRALKRQAATRDIPVIMLTARGEMGAILDCQNEGAIDYFIKPFDWEELLKYIKKYTVISSENALIP